MNRFFAVLSLLLMLAPGAAGAATLADRQEGSGRALNGREVYVQTCAMCHANGVGGAPRPGHAEDWVDRNRYGTAELLVSVLRGKGGMPAKGGNASLTRSEAYVAMDFMLNGLK